MLTKEPSGSLFYGNGIRPQMLCALGHYEGDDALHLKRYHAKFWAIKGVTDEHGHPVEVELTTETPLPFREAAIRKSW